MVMHHGYAAWTMDMQRGGMDMKHGHAAWTYSMGKQHGYGARTCGMDMQHGQAAKRSSMETWAQSMGMQYWYHSEWTCKMEMHDRQATWTYRLDIHMNKQHGQAVRRHGDGDMDMEHEYEVKYGRATLECRVNTQNGHA
jgi:hypothetical protein